MGVRQTYPLTLGMYSEAWKKMREKCGIRFGVNVAGGAVMPLPVPSGNKLIFMIGTGQRATQECNNDVDWHAHRRRYEHYSLTYQ